MNNRKIFFLLCMVIICFFLYSCNREQNQREEDLSVKATKISHESDADFSHIKKHVVWYHDELITMNTDTRVFTEFNNLLLKRGYDFVVDFVTEPSFTEEQYRTYQNNLRKYKEEGRQVDLIFTGWAPVGERTYDAAVRDELLLPLDEYLESEEGQRLYEVFSPSLWEMMRRDGRVYGICENGWYGDYYSAVLNKNLLEKYETEVPAEFSFEGYFETLHEAYEKAKEQGDALPAVYLTADAMYSCLGYYKVGDFFIKRTEDNKVAFVNPYEDDAVREVFKLLEKYQEVFGECGSYEEYLRAERMETALSHFCATLMKRSCSNRNTSYPAYTYEPQQMFYSMPMHNIVHGVSSWATYPEEAKTLLTLISTDEEFINLLYHGVEGVHYRLEDGRAIEADEDEPGGMEDEIRVNERFVYPRLAEPDNKKEVLQEHQQEVVFLPLEMEVLQKEPLSEEEKVIAELFRRAEGLWLGEYENAEEVAEQICEELEAAQVEEVLRKRTERIYPKEE